MDKVCKYITNKIVELTDCIYCNSETVLVDIPIDSIKFITLIVEIEKEYGFEFEEDMLFYNQFTSIGDIIGYVWSQIELKE